MNLIAAIRSKGYMLIIVTLHSSMLDKIPREYVTNYEFSVYDEGIARVYSRFFPTFAKKAFNKSKGVLKVCLPGGYEAATDTGCDNPDCLECKFMKAKEENPDRCYNIRAIYERRKVEFINKMSQKDDSIPTKKRTREERISLLLENKDLWNINRKGNILLSSIQTILADNGEPSGENTARSLKNQIEADHPDIAPSN